MEVEQTIYGRTDTMGDKGNIIQGQEQVILKKKFEWGGPSSDPMSRVISGGYTQNWNGDFLQKDLGKDGTVARFYYDSKVCIDIGDPDADIARRKRKLCFKNGLGYLCIPPNFPKDEDRIKTLYEASLEDYEAYEGRHPRPAVLQETILIGKDGVPRKTLVTAIDIKPGGKIVGNVDQQAAQLRKAVKLTKSEIIFEKLRAKLHRRLRRSLQHGRPFRNPFVTKHQRQFPVLYS
jgi:hypothetical protein